VLFRYGFVFSVGLTLLPIPLAVVGWVFRLVFG
jgi:heme/copper-type cytochrome/quinol oxidase subunit 4